MSLLREIRDDLERLETKAAALLEDVRKMNAETRAEVESLSAKLESSQKTIDKYEMYRGCPRDLNDRD